MAITGYIQNHVPTMLSINPMAKIEDTEKLEVKKDSLPWLPHACPIIAIQFNPYIIYSMATPLKPNQARSESSWFSKLPP